MNEKIVVWVPTESVETVKHITGSDPVHGLIMHHPMMTDKSLQGFSVKLVDLSNFIDKITSSDEKVRAYYFEDAGA